MPTIPDRGWHRHPVTRTPVWFDDHGVFHDWPDMPDEARADLLELITTREDVVTEDERDRLIGHAGAPTPDLVDDEVARDAARWLGIPIPDPVPDDDDDEPERIEMVDGTGRVVGSIDGRPAEAWSPPDEPRPIWHAAGLPATTRPNGGGIPVWAEPFAVIVTDGERQLWWRWQA